MARRIVTLAPSEQAVLDRLTVRLLRPDEQARWDELITTRHYLHNAHLVGEQLRYVAETDGQWQALLGGSAPAYHLKGRDTWIGWSAEQRRARLHLLANNARFLVLTEPGQLPNLASRALALCCARLSADWQARYGHPVVAVESFVDTQLTRGTAYKAAGWQALGATAGFTRVNEDFYLAHARPKTLFVRWLHQKAAPWLRALQLPPTLAPHEKKVVPRCPQSVEELQSLWWHLHRTVPEARSALGLRHKQATVLAITLSCLLTGHRGGYRQAALFAQGLTQVQRRHLRCWRHEKTSRFDVPSENCFFRVLSAVDVAALGRALVSWQAARTSSARWPNPAGAGSTWNACRPKPMKFPPRARSSHAGNSTARSPCWMRCTRRSRRPAKLCRTRVGIMSSSSKATSRDCWPKRASSCRRAFPPQVVTREDNRGRRERRALAVRTVDSAQMGFPHARQLARLERQAGSGEKETVWVITSLGPEQAGPERLLELTRAYWGIENGGHGRLDNSGDEDRCRVRHPVAATALAWLRRFILGEFTVWARGQPKARDRTLPTFYARFRRNSWSAVHFVCAPTARV